MRRILPSSRTLLPAVTGLLALLFAVAAPDSALAGQCIYTGGETDDGPCMEFKNQREGTLDLYCLQGPTEDSHKIALANGDDFTCKVRDENADVARTNLDGTSKTHTYDCGGETETETETESADAQKQDVTLTEAGSWSVSCHSP